MKNLYSYLWLIPLYTFLQVLILNNIQFINFINPLVYLIIIITLSQDTERWFILFISFILGIMLDVFEGNIGMNSSSLVFIGFLLPYIQNGIIPKNTIDEKEKLNLNNLGIQTFSIYSFTIILIHNLFFFILEHFSLENILFVILKVICSSIVTLIIIIIFQLFLSNQKD